MKAILAAITLAASLPSCALGLVGTASVEISNIKWQIIGTGMEIRGPTYVNYGAPGVPTAGGELLSTLDFVHFSDVGFVDDSSFTAISSADSLASLLQVRASALNEVVGLIGDISKGGQSPQFPNVLIYAHTTVVLSFDVLTSASLTGVAPGIAKASLDFGFGSNHVTVATCIGGWGPYNCSGLAGLPPSAHVEWTMSAGEADIGTTLGIYTRSMIQATTNVTPIPEPATFTLLAFGIATLTLLRNLKSGVPRSRNQRVLEAEAASGGVLI